MNTIDEFLRIGHISKKMLRHNANGLLVPES